MTTQQHPEPQPVESIDEHRRARIIRGHLHLAELIVGHPITKRVTA